MVNQFANLNGGEGDGRDSINFMDASDGVVSLLWEFGDGFQFVVLNTSTMNTDAEHTN